MYEENGPNPAGLGQEAPKPKSEVVEQRNEVLRQRETVALDKMRELVTKFPGSVTEMGQIGNDGFVITKQPLESNITEKAADGVSDIPVKVDTHAILTEKGWRLLDVRKSPHTSSYENSEQYLQDVLDNTESYPNLAKNNGSYYGLNKEGEEVLIIGNMDGRVQVRGRDIVVKLGSEDSPYLRLKKIDASNVDTLNQIIGKAKENAGIYPEVQEDIDAAQEDIDLMNSISF